MDRIDKILISSDIIPTDLMFAFKDNYSRLFNHKLLWESLAPISEGGGKRLFKDPEL